MLFLDMMDFDSKMRTKNNSDHYSVFATDHDVATIMAFTRAKVSWNINIKKVG